MLSGGGREGGFGLLGLVGPGAIGVMGKGGREGGWERGWGKGG